MQWESGTKGIQIIKNGQIISQVLNNDVDDNTTTFGTAITELVTGDQVIQ